MFGMPRPAIMHLPKIGRDFCVLTTAKHKEFAAAHQPRVCESLFPSAKYWALGTQGCMATRNDVPQVGDPVNYKWEVRQAERRLLKGSLSPEWPVAD